MALTEYVRGTDASALQRQIGPKGWTALYDSGVRFGFLRCGIGNEPYRDARLAENVRDALDAGVAVAPYMFLYPLPHLDPREQARYHARLAEYSPGRMLGAEVGQPPPAADLEWPAREIRNADGSISYPWHRWGCSPQQLRDWGLYYLDEMEHLWGCRPLVYSYPYWLQCVEISKSIDYARYPLWLANYFAKGRWPSVEELQKLRPPAPWGSIKIVQHDGDGGLRLPGSGIDADFNCFLGSLDDLRDFSLVPREPPIENTIDVERAVADARRIVVDEGIAEYRRARLDRELEAA